MQKPTFIASTVRGETRQRVFICAYLHHVVFFLNNHQFPVLAIFCNSEVSALDTRVAWPFLPTVLTSETFTLILHFTNIQEQDGLGSSIDPFIGRQNLEDLPDTWHITLFHMSDFRWISFCGFLFESLGNKPLHKQSS